MPSLFPRRYGRANNNSIKNAVASKFRPHKYAIHVNLDSKAHFRGAENWSTHNRHNYTPVHKTRAARLESSTITHISKPASRKPECIAISKPASWKRLEESVYAKNAWGDVNRNNLESQIHRRNEASI
jgi:hypothetical protein